MELVGFVLVMFILTYISQRGGHALHFNANQPYRNSNDPADFRWIFRENGIEPDIVTYTAILKLIRAGDIEEAEQLIRTHYNLPIAVSEEIARGLDREFISNTTNRSTLSLLFTLGIVFPGIVVMMILAWAIFTL